MEIKQHDFSDSLKKFELLNKKKEKHQVKITTYISGSVKNSLIDDCSIKKKSESQTARSILDIYYKEILPLIPRHEYMDFVKIKQYINKNIKFK